MYQWDFDSLLEMKKELIRLKKERRKELTKKDILRIENSIDTYNFLLTFFDENKEEYDFDEDIDDKTFRARYFYHLDRNINPRIINACIGSLKILEEMEYPDNLETFSYLDIDCDDVINMTKEIFSTFKDQNIMKMVEDLLNPDKHLLHVANDMQSCIFDADYSGYSCRDSYNNIGYIVLFKNGKIRDLYTLVHEIFHIIIKQQSLPGYFTDDKEFIAEVEGAFSDLIVTDYLRKKGLYLDDIHNVELLNYDTIKYFVRNLCVSHKYSSIMEDNTFAINKINSKISEDGYNFKIKGEYIRPSLLSFSRDLNYSFSYLVALDLFYDYKQNPTNSFWKLRRLAKLNNNVLDSFRTLGITFMQDGYRNLRNYQKSLKKEKE